MHTHTHTHTLFFHVHTSSYSKKTCSPSSRPQAPCDPSTPCLTGYHGSKTPLLQRQVLFVQSPLLALRLCLELFSLLLAWSYSATFLCVCVCHLGLSSGGALLKLTTGICRVAGRECSEGARKGLGGRRGERRGELSPLLRRSGERGAQDTEFCSSSPSSSSRMDGSFFTKPPLLSQST